MTFTFKMLKQMFLHTCCFIPCICPIIAFVINPSKSEFISGFPYILLTTSLTREKINQTVTISWFILNLSPVVVPPDLSVLEHLSKLHTLIYQFFRTNLCFRGVEFRFYKVTTYLPSTL